MILNTKRFNSFACENKTNQFKDSFNIKNENTVWHQASISRIEREQLNCHRGGIIWFTGLSGSGKSTLANALAKRLHSRKARAYVLDGDNIRQGLCQDLGFSVCDRSENIRRIGEVSKLMMDAGMIVITAFISPFIKDRKLVRDLVKPGEFIEVHCDTPLKVCEERDVKGLYQRARKGEIGEFTGISSPYECPEKAEVKVQTDLHTVDECVERIMVYLFKNNIIDTLKINNSNENKALS